MCCTECSIYAPVEFIACCVRRFCVEEIGSRDNSPLWEREGFTLAMPDVFSVEHNDAACNFAGEHTIKRLVDLIEAIFLRD